MSLFGDGFYFIALLFATQHEQLFSLSSPFGRHDSVSGIEKLPQTVQCIYVLPL